MRLFWWQQLPLLILVQLLDPSITTHKFHVEASLTFKSSATISEKFRGLKVSSNGYELKENRVASLFSQKPVHSSNHNNGDEGVSGVPTLTPAQGECKKKHKTRKVAAIIGGAVAAFLVILVVIFVYFSLMRVKRKFMRRTSESASSVPSPPAEWERGNTTPYAVPLSPFETEHSREFTISELDEATCGFSRNNIIGEGRFGLAYKGLLRDGSIVAIKRCLHTPTRSFFQHVRNVARVHHLNLVKLVGYYHDSDQQFLVYDYVSNGNVGDHLYDNKGLPVGKLGVRQRLAIALGAAKGLGHLHGLTPPLLHMHFRTRNVLLDEYFTAKVSDYGLTTLLIEGNHAGSSSSFDCFLDPELDMQKRASERSDVYGFGVFLLELISGHEANAENLVLKAKESEGFEGFVDKWLGKQARFAAKAMMEVALRCVDSCGERRPEMKVVAEALERLHEGELARLSSELDSQIEAVTLGSELFK